MQLGTYLQTQSFGTLGVDIRLGYAPDQEDDLIALYLTGEWRPAEWTFGKRVWEHPTVQIIVRNSNPADALQTAGDLYAALDRLGKTTMDGGVEWHMIRAMKPVFMGPDSRNRAEYSINLQVTKRPN